MYYSVVNTTTRVEYVALKNIKKYKVINND